MKLPLVARASEFFIRWPDKRQHNLVQRRGNGTHDSILLWAGGAQDDTLTIVCTGVRSRTKTLHAETLLEAEYLSLGLTSPDLHRLGDIVHVHHDGTLAVYGRKRDGDVRAERLPRGGGLFVADAL